MGRYQGLKLSIEEIAQTAANAADDKRGENIAVLDLRGLSLMTDYFVIADATSVTQVRAVADGVSEALEDRGVPAPRREGWDEGRWILLDYGDVVVHVFRTEDREYYDLERLWGDAPRLVLGDESRLVPVES